MKKELINIIKELKNLIKNTMKRWIGITQELEKIEKIKKNR